MNTYRLAVPACAALAITLAGCSAETPPSDHSSKKPDAVGSSPHGVAPITAIATPNAQPAQPPTVPQTLDDPTAMTGMDTGQAQALATCRALVEARKGTLARPGPDEIAVAARDLAADPNALAECQAGM